MEEEVEKKIEEAVEPEVAEVAGATIDAVKPASLDWQEAVMRDRRVGYLLADLLAGESLDESVNRHFGESLKTVERDDAAIAEAEQRGYLKARNELASKEMARPGIWQMPQSEAPTEGDELAFLSRVRPSVWD